jgi:hypothetical protein
MQIAKNTQKTLDKMTATLDGLKKQQITKPTDDPLDDDSQKNLRETIDMVQKKVDALADMVQSTEGTRQKHWENQYNELEDEKGQLDVLKLQEDTADPERFPEALNLKTTVPIAKLDDELKQKLPLFGDEKVRVDNFNKYFTDENYRKECNDKGVILSKELFDSENIRKLNEVLLANQAVVEGKFPDMTAAYLYRCHTSGKLAQALKDAKLAGSNAAIEKVSKENTETPTIPADQAGGAGGEPIWTISKALQFLKDNPDPKLGSAEAKKVEEIHDILDKGEFGS